jgi:hypothetical protein
MLLKNVLIIFFSMIASSSADINRLPDGTPDLNGVWQVLNSANYNLEPHPAKAAMAMVPGPFGPLPAKEVLALGAVGSVPAGLGVIDGGEIPYKAAARKKQIENQKNWLKKDPEVKCYLPGVPRATYLPFPFQIHQSESAFVFTYAFAGAVRNLIFNSDEEAPIDSWMGQSNAVWEGDTLVIRASGFNDSTWFDRAGNHHSDALKVTERYTLRNEHIIEYEALIEDENVFTRPWTIRMPIYKRVGRDAQLLQFKCIPFVEELLYGELRKIPKDQGDLK